MLSRSSLLYLTRHGRWAACDAPIPRPPPPGPLFCPAAHAPGRLSALGLQAFDVETLEDDSMKRSVAAMGIRWHSLSARARTRPSAGLKRRSTLSILPTSHLFSRAKAPSIRMFKIHHTGPTAPGWSDSAGRGSSSRSPPTCKTPPAFALKCHPRATPRHCLRLVCSHYIHGEGTAFA